MPTDKNFLKFSKLPSNYFGETLKINFALNLTCSLLLVFSRQMSKNSQTTAEEIGYYEKQACHYNFTRKPQL